jgi:V/A-type H+-transporting ATPase subunit K
VKRSLIAKFGLMAMMLLVGMTLFVPAAMAQEHGEDADGAAEDGGGMGKGLIAVGAGLAVGLAGLGTGNAQAGVGAGGTGAIAEKPEVFTNVLILFAIPETIVILGFVIGFLLLGNI